MVRAQVVEGANAEIEEEKKQPVPLQPPARAAAGQGLLQPIVVGKKKSGVLGAGPGIVKKPEPEEEKKEPVRLRQPERRRIPKKREFLDVNGNAQPAAAQDNQSEGFIPEESKEQNRNAAAALGHNNNGENLLQSPSGNIPQNMQKPASNGDKKAAEKKQGSKDEKK